MRERRPEVWQSTWASMMGVSALQRLRVGCTFVPNSEPGNWFGVVRDPRPTTVLDFELALGLEQARTDYNLKALEAARKTGTVRILERAGFADLFVPVVKERQVFGVLVCGPILKTRPTTQSLKEAWAELTRLPVDPDAPMFLSFVRSTLESHAFEGDAFDYFVSHVRFLAEVMAGAKLASRRDMKAWLSFRRRIPELGMWELAAELVNQQANSRWIASYRELDRAQEGLSKMPSHVLSLAPFWRDGSATESAEVMLRNHEFQRACAQLALELPNTIAGRIGSEAAFLMTHLDDNTRRERARLLALGERWCRQLKQKLRTDIVCGISARAVHGGELPLRYDEALRAVLWSLHKDQPITFATEAEAQSHATGGLYASTRLLYESFGQRRRREAMVAAERVVKDVLWSANNSVAVMRSHFLQILWELLALSERCEAIDKRTRKELQAALGLRLERARATHEVTNSFVEIVAELSDTRERPGELGRHAKLERARQLVQQALLDRAESSSRLDLNSVARKVGMSRSLFSESFRRTYGTTFGAFVLSSRLERTKKLLKDTELRPIQVSREAGWSSPSYFHQAFKRLTRMTPDQFRASVRSARRKA